MTSSGAGRGTQQTLATVIITHYRVCCSAGDQQAPLIWLSAVGTDCPDSTPSTFALCLHLHRRGFVNDS